MGSAVCLRRLRTLRLSDTVENGFACAQRTKRTAQCSRDMATVSDIQANASQQMPVEDTVPKGTPTSHPKPVNPITIHALPPPITRSVVPPISLSDKSVLATLYSFPYLEPLQHLYFSSSHLAVPMRRDILHRAVTYEADNARQGTASTKWRSEVRGTSKKVMPQKGQGRARAGDKNSPIRRGGGVAFGPKPRDFGTDLPNKVYDLAWRIALSHRYAKGELVIVDKIMTPEDPENGPGQGGRDWWMKEILNTNRWGQADGRSMLIAERRDDNEEVFSAMKAIGMAGKIAEMNKADVRQVLSLGRVIIEWKVLTKLIHKHQRDLKRKIPSAYLKSVGGAAPSIGVAAMEEQDGFDDVYEEGEELAEELVDEEDLRELRTEEVLKDEESGGEAIERPRA